MRTELARYTMWQVSFYSTITHALVKEDRSDSLARLLKRYDLDVRMVGNDDITMLVAGQECYSALCLVTDDEKPTRRVAQMRDRKLPLKFNSRGGVADVRIPKSRRDELTFVVRMAEA